MYLQVAEKDTMLRRPTWGKHKKDAKAIYFSYYRNKTGGLYFHLVVQCYTFMDFIGFLEKFKVALYFRLLVNLRHGTTKQILVMALTLNWKDILSRRPGKVI
jgi:hypothetical protein